MSIHETILCIERTALPPSWVETMTAVALSESAFYEQIPDNTVRFLNRKSVETDPCFKQIIPYLLLHDQAGSGSDVISERGQRRGFMICGPSALAAMSAPMTGYPGLTV